MFAITAEVVDHMTKQFASMLFNHDNVVYVELQPTIMPVVYITSVNSTISTSSIDELITNDPHSPFAIRYKEGNVTECNDGHVLLDALCTNACERLLRRFQLQRIRVCYAYPNYHVYIGAWR